MEYLPSSVKVKEVYKVAPAVEAAAAPSPASLPLTFFDLAWLRMHPIQRLFFYELPSDYDIISFVNSVIVPNLKSSLSQTLRHYVPLAGNLVWPELADVPTVEFVEGGGVSVTVAESDADFDHLSGNGFRQVCEFHPLVPHLLVSRDRAAVIALQVTTFKNRGFSIGITNHHAILDGKTTTSFIKLWAQICKELQPTTPTITKLTPFYDRSVIADPTGLAKITANAWLDKEAGPNTKNLNLKLLETEPGLIRATFELTRKNIQNLKNWFLNKKTTSTCSHISTFVVATAYLCLCSAKLEGLKQGKLMFVFAVDARSRLNPRVPANYFGNCLAAAFVRMERSELWGENGLVVAVEEISKAVKNSDDGVLEGAEESGPRMRELADDYGKNETFCTAGSPRFEVYSADFGWGKPVKVEIVSAETPFHFALQDGRNSDVGMEIGVVKDRAQMERFAAIFHQGLECL